jgi:hypothetical protein
MTRSTRASRAKVTRVTKPVATGAGPVPPTPPAAAAPPVPAPAPDVSPNPKALPIVFIAPPPAGATIPAIPAGFEPTNGANYRGTQAQKAELVALPHALADLRSFASYPAILGAAAPSLAELVQAFDVSNQWSTMRNASSAWDAYCRDQEGLAWMVMRALMDRLKPAFLLAVRTNPSLASTYAGLAAFLGAKTVTAHKSAATRKRNKKNVAEGKLPTHGQVGKAHTKAAAKAALAAQSAKPATNPSEPVAPAAEVGPVVMSAPAPVATPVASANPSGGVVPSNGTPRS